jgi:UTP--glucose-1-phosphate uridylyltransferase
MTPGLEFGACHRKQLEGVLTPGVDLKNLNEGSKMAARVRKAVFPVAGLGTRFLPATKAMPKEMLTVVDRPLIQHVVDEAREAGIEHFIFVTGRNKGVIEDHFDRQFELEEVLAARGKTSELERLNDHLPGPGTTSFTRQQEPLGLGHAVWCARELVGSEPFALLLPDVLVQTPGKGCLAQMLEVYVKYGGNIIAVDPVPEDQVKNYGVVSIGEGDGRVFPVNGMVEKPKPGTEPSNLTILGRYILQPEIFDLLSGQERGAGGEIQITDAMLALLKVQPFYALKYEGKTFDCGSKVGFLTANVAYALTRPDIAEAFANEVKKLV